MSEKQNKVIFTTEDNENVEFFVIEQTKLNGCTYLLVTDSDDVEDEGNAYILKDLSNDTDESSTYCMVDDDNELEIIAKIFEELVDDIEFE